MILRGPVTLAPSRLARRLLLLLGPGVTLVLLAAAVAARHPWPLLPLPAVLLLVRSAARSWDRVRGLDLRPAAVCVDVGDGCWQPVRPCGEPRISSLALCVPLRLEASGDRLWLTVWCDAVDVATFRRLARILRHGRWPRAAGAEHRLPQSVEAPAARGMHVEPER